MPKAGKKNHIFGDFFSEATKKNAKTGKEFGIEGKKEALDAVAVPVPDINHRLELAMPCSQVVL